MLLSIFRCKHFIENSGNRFLSYSLLNSESDALDSVCFMVSAMSFFLQY